MFDIIKEFIGKIFKSRVFVLSVVMILLTSVLLGRLFYLQILKGESYQNNYRLRIQKTRVLNSTRGNIYDRNGNLLAYNELAHSIIIEDNGEYDDLKERNA
ncbi:MAG: peptidoglycan glycosyltransferase, partial [Lachnospiraceae bacterium]|nr:peptidoglycan glycosyltransferase [Lachnospiraceae bacterium]